MKAAWYERCGRAADVLQVGVLPSPKPKDDEVVVQVSASGVNPSDVKTRMRLTTVPRFVPHSDGAGVIVDVGAGVSKGRIGERVWLWNAAWKRVEGTASELVALPAEQAVNLPANTSFAEGACFGIPALTALRAVTVDGGVVGQTVLIQGGAGAVGAYALQFARLSGASKIITTVSSDEKRDICLSLGADHVINYKSEDVVARVEDITSGSGVHRIIEVDASANSHLAPELLRREGVYVIYGSVEPKVSLASRPMMMLGASVRFFIVYELSSAVREGLIGALNGYLTCGALRHRIGARYSLDDIVMAHEMVESGKSIGTVIVEF